MKSHLNTTIVSHRAKALLIKLLWLAALLTTPGINAFAKTDATDATLSSMVIDSPFPGVVTFNKPFDPAVTKYTVGAPNESNVLFITVTTTDPLATTNIHIDGQDNDSSGGDAPIGFSPNNTATVTVTVTSADGSKKKAYTVKIVRLPQLAELSSLSLSQSCRYCIGIYPNETFDPEKFNYTATVAYEQTVSFLTAVGSELYPSDLIKVNGQTVEPSSQYPYYAGTIIPLNQGANVIKISVKSPDSSKTNTYTVTITRLPPRTDDALINLTIFQGFLERFYPEDESDLPEVELSPSFNSGVASYIASVPAAVSQISMFPKQADFYGHMSVNGIPLTNVDQRIHPFDIPLYYDNLNPINLKPGKNTFKIVVTAQDSVTTKTYTITITRQAPVTTPTVQASNVSVHAIDYNSAKINWTRGNGSARAVFIYQGTTGTASPVDGTEYAENGNYGWGDQIGNSGWYCIYNGQSSGIQVTGLTPTTGYRVAVVEYNGYDFNDVSLAGFEKYLATQITPVNFTTAPAYPTGQARQVAVSKITGSSATVKWTNGNGSARAVFIREGASGSPLPADYNTYIANANVGSGQQIDATGWYCVYNGTGPAVSITNLTAGETYRVAVVDYLGSPGNERYIDPSLTPGSPNYTSSMLSPANFTTPSPYPTYQAVKVKFEDITISSATASWVNGSGTARAVFIRAGANGSALPADNASYKASTNFGAGQQIGTTGWYCIYNGTGTATSISGLSAGTTYRVTVVEYNGTAGHQKYNVNGLSPANVTTTQVYPTVSALQVKFTNTTNNSTTANWINGNGAARAVFIRPVTSGSAMPADNTTYAANASFGSGQQIGNSGWYCVYNGTGSGVNITGLSAATIYRVTVVEYDGAVGNEKYKVTALSPANVTTGLSGLNGLFINNSEATPLTVLPGNQPVEANNVLSPNGDGFNDIWIVKNIAFYPNNSVTVYNKAGMVVYNKKNYTNDWAGTYKGATLAQGTYYYLISLGNGKNIKGFFTVLKF